jgi:hypothetical protein
MSDFDLLVSEALDETSLLCDCGTDQTQAIFDI